ncbi:MAG: rod shape-determining protein MreC [Treponemataceae bacterium]
MFKKKAINFQLSLVCFVFYVLITGFVLAFSTASFVINFKQVGFSILTSVQSGVNSSVAFCVSGITAIRDLAALRSEYELLVKKLENYEYLQRSNAEIRKENDRLREQLGFIESYPKKNIPARIIGRDPNTLYSALVIDKGIKHGIKKNMPVIAFQQGNIGLVGKIVEVGSTTSMVVPLYDFQFNVSSRIQYTRDIGLITGMGYSDLNLVMKYIKKKVADEISYGDIVVTSGESESYDREIPIGTISKINILDYDTAIELEVTPIINFSRLETVIVVNREDIND